MLTIQCSHSWQMPSVTLKFLRAGAVGSVADEMRDANDIPVRFLKSSNTDAIHDHLFADGNDTWDNFVRIKWNFYARYCAQEGLTRCPSPKTHTHTTLACLPPPLPGAWISRSESSYTSSMERIDLYARSERTEKFRRSRFCTPSTTS